MGYLLLSAFFYILQSIAADLGDDHPSARRYTTDLDTRSRRYFYF